MAPPVRTDFALVHRTLRAGRATPAWMASWLPATWNDEAGFRAALLASAAGAGGLDPAPKGRPETGFALYQDLVSRHLGRQRVALVVRSEGAAIETTFDRLHDRCSALASRWAAEGAKPGDAVAIALPVGIDWAAAVLAALRMGLVATTLPPAGRSWLRERIARAAPDWLVASGRVEAMVGAERPPALPLARGGDMTLSSSHTWADAEVALRLFSPFGDPDADPVEVTAGSLHVGAIVDGWLVHALAPGDRLAAPGFDPLQMQPLAALAAWMAGAAWVELDPKDVETDPRALVDAGVTTLGVVRRLRDPIQRQGAEVHRRIRAWFRGLEDVLDWDGWDRFGRAMAESKSLGHAVLASAASAGANLFAPPLPVPAPLEAWPAPGCAWQLSHVGAGLLSAFDDAGVFTPLRDEEPDPTYPRFVLAKSGPGFTIGGSIEPGPRARAVLAREIVAAAESHPSVHAAAVVVLPSRLANDAHVVLLLFADVRRTEAGGWDPPIPAAEVRALVAAEVGEDHVQERIEISPVRPRMHEGTVDVRWARSHYLGGALAAKARSPLFAAIARLGWILGPAGPGA